MNQMDTNILRKFQFGEIHSPEDKFSVIGIIWITIDKLEIISNIKIITEHRITIIDISDINQITFINYISEFPKNENISIDESKKYELKFMNEKNKEYSVLIYCSYLKSFLFNSFSNSHVVDNNKVKLLELVRIDTHYDSLIQFFNNYKTNYECALQERNRRKLELENQKITWIQYFKSYFI